MQLLKATRNSSVLLATAAFAAGVPAQQIVYPAKGQSAQQQKKDEGECHVWAVDNSKYDPANPPKQAAAPPPPTTATGTTPGAGVRGAARGAPNSRPRSGSGGSRGRRRRGRLLRRIGRVVLAVGDGPGVALALVLLLLLGLLALRRVDDLLCRNAGGERGQGYDHRELPCSLHGAH